ncbi:MAG: hypothetical protein AAFS10_13625, partial [Myxococcota bacterium]
YSAVPPGEYRAIFLEAGTQNPLGNGFSVSNINIASGEASTLVVSEDASGAPVGQVIPDDLTAPGENGARYRFVYRASGPRGDLYDTSTGALIQQGLSLGQLTLYSDIDGGTYTFEVRPEGLTQVMHTIEQVDLKPGVVYTIFVLGNGDPNMDDNVVDSNVSHVLVMDWDFN